MKKLLLLIIAAGLTVSACSLPTDEEVVLISPEKLPDVLRSDLEVTTTTIAAVPAAIPIQVYLIATHADRNIVVPVIREVDPAASFQDRISLLFGQEIRSQDEIDLGWGNPLRAFDLTEAFINENQVAIIDMVSLDIGGDVVAPEAQELQDAAAQLTYTATGFDGILAVRIRINGESGFLPTDEGDSDAVVTRSAFETYDAEFVVATTTVPPTTLVEEG